MSLFAIRQKSTGHYLPQPPKVGAGYTNFSPAPITQYPPRLFTDKHGARCALTWWLKGRYTSDNEGAMLRIRDEYQPARDPNDFEVIEVAIIAVPVAANDDPVQVAA